MHLPPRELVLISLTVAATLLGDSLLYAVLPVVWPQLGLELWMVGVLLSANRFVRFVTNPLAGWIVERVGVRRPFIAAVFLSVFTTAVYGLRAGFAVFLAGRLVWGLCWSFLRLGGFLSALRHADDRNRGYYLGFYSGVCRVGTLVSVLCGGFLTDIIGFQQTIWMFAIFTLVGGMIIVRVRMDSAADERLAYQPSSSPAGTDGGDIPIIRDRRLWAVYAAVFINGVAGSQLVVATLGLWLLERYGQSIHVAQFTIGVASLTGILLSGRYLIEVVWAPSAGHISDRVNRLRFIRLVGAVTVVTIVGLTFRLDLFWAVPLAFGVFLSGTALRVALDAIAGELAPPAARARIMSWYSNWSDLGNAVGPFLAYQLVGFMGLEWVYRTAAGFLVVGGLTALSFLREKKAFQRDG